MAGRRASQGTEPINPLGWMITFSDLVTLLLTFFVLLIAMSSMDVRAIKDSFSMFSEGPGVLDFAKEDATKPPPNLVQFLDQAPPDAMDPNRLKEMLFTFTDVDFQRMMELVSPDITVAVTDRGLIIQIASYILFNEGGAELRPEFLPLLAKIGQMLRSTRRPVSVEGHTDDSPLEGSGGPWAWELSLDRAIAVVDYLTSVENLPPERFRAGGFGPSKPLAPNDSPRNRTRNRRIEIILHKDQFD